MNLLVVVLMLAQPGNAEIFADRDQTYVRAGSAQGLEVGQAINVVSKDGKTVGSAVTLEVWESLARVRLDESAEHFSGPKRAVVGKGVEPEDGKTAAQLKDDGEDNNKDDDDDAPPKPGELKGRASVIGVWQGKRITIENAGHSDWHHCKLRLPDQRHFDLGDLAHEDSEHVMLFRFEGGNPFSTSDVPLDSIQVKCAEGTAKLRLPL